MDQIRIGKSKISGKGGFSLRNFKKGDYICRLRGERVSLDKILAKIKEGKDNFLSDPLQVGNKDYILLEEKSRCLNHSCNPNAGINKKNVLVARKKIKKGEEITYDYSLTMFEDEKYIMKKANRKPWSMNCRCGQKNCRKRIRQFYQLPKSMQSEAISKRVVQDFIIRNYKP